MYLYNIFVVLLPSGPWDNYLLLYFYFKRLEIQAQLLEGMQSIDPSRNVQKGNSCFGVTEKIKGDCKIVFHVL